MEYKEAPGISGASRNLIFPVIKWLSKSKFEEYLSLKYAIHPYINTVDDINEDSPSNRVYTGKLDVIGSVLKDLNGEWQLRVPHGSAVTEFKRDFLVLCIQDPQSFQWVRSKNKQIPKYALRGANDEFTNEYFYIGKTIREAHIQPKYYRGTWVVLNEETPLLFGKVHTGHECLYVAHNGLELAFNEYDVLCMKPSPASLKILCRLRVRAMAHHSNRNIGLINQNRLTMPESLVNFLKYPAFISVGEYMLRGEKISDGKSEILIENNGDLVCKSIVDETNRDSLEHVKRIIHSGVHSVWLHRFQVVFCLTNGRIYIAHSFVNQSPEYKFSINYDVMPPNYQVTEGP